MVFKFSPETGFLDFIAGYHSAESSVTARLMPPRRNQTRQDNRCRNCDEEKPDEKRCFDCPWILLPQLYAAEEYVKAAQEILWLLNTHQQEMSTSDQEIIDQG